MSVLELFLQGEGGQKMRDTLLHFNMFDEDPCAYWNQALMPIVNLLAQYLYPSFLLNIYIKINMK